LCGGLTAHYRLGARAPAATQFAGALLIVIALLFGKAAVSVRTFIPLAIFGALLFYVGWQHLLLGSNVAQRRHLMLAAVAFPPSPGIIVY
jgi:MFS superfamily sulfate permease-like transporter